MTETAEQAESKEPARAKQGLLFEGLQRVDATLLLGSVWALGVNVIGVGLGLLTQTLLGQTLGPDGYGIYLTVLGWSNVAGLICALEFSNAAIRFVSAYSATGQWGLLRGFVRKTHQIVGTASLSVGLLAAIGLLMAHGINSEMRSAFFVACALFPLTSIIQLEGGCLLGFKKIGSSQAPYQIVRPALFALGLIIASNALGKGFNAGDAVLLQLIATGVGLAGTFYYLSRSTPPEVRNAAPVYRTLEWVKTSSHFIAISMAQLVLSTQSDLLFVSWLLGTTQAGLYGAASQFAMIVGFGANAIMVMAQPMIADLYARGQISKLLLLARQIVGLTAVASVPVFAFVTLLGPKLLRLYGVHFVPAYPVLVVLAMSQLVAATAGMLLGYLFTMTAHQEKATRVIGMSAALNVALTLLLTPKFGIIGTASSTAVATLVRTLWLMFEARGILRSTTVADADTLPIHDIAP